MIYYVFREWYAYPKYTVKRSKNGCALPASTNCSQLSLGIFLHFFRRIYNSHGRNWYQIWNLFLIWKLSKHIKHFKIYVRDPWTSYGSFLKNSRWPPLYLFSVFFFAIWIASTYVSLINIFNCQLSKAYRNH